MLGAVAFIHRQWDRRDADVGLSLAIEEHSSGDAVGMIGAFHRPQPHVVGLGYWIVPPARGHHFAQRAIALFAGRVDSLGCEKAELVVVAQHAR